MAAFSTSTHWRDIGRRRNAAMPDVDSCDRLAGTDSSANAADRRASSGTTGCSGTRDGSLHSRPVERLRLLNGRSALDITNGCCKVPEKKLQHTAIRSGCLTAQRRRPLGCCVVCHFVRKIKPFFYTVIALQHPSWSGLAGCLVAGKSSGSVFLGVPVGGKAFIRKFNDETLSKLDDMLFKSCRLHSGLRKFLILRACFGVCPVNHRLRSLQRWGGTSSAPFRRAVG